MATKTKKQTVAAEVAKHLRIIAHLLHNESVFVLENYGSRVPACETSKMANKNPNLSLADSLLSFEHVIIEAAQTLEQ